jgi:hypothetical protein
MTGSATDLQINGNLTYNGGSIITNVTSNIRLMGGVGTTQYILGNTPLNVSNLRIENNARVLLNNAQSALSINVTGILSIGVDSRLIIGNRTITANQFQFTDRGYIVTADEFGVPATGGGVRGKVQAMAGLFAVFPIGPNETNFTPVTITNANSIEEDFTVRVVPGNPIGTNTNYTLPYTWYIEEATPGGNIMSVKLGWLPSFEPDDFSNLYCSLVKTDGTQIVQTGYSLQPGATTDQSYFSIYKTKTSTGITSFSPWSVTSEPMLLPVNLLNFNFQLTNANKVLFNWQLAQGSTPHHFEILKSNNGVDFSLLKTIQATTLLTYNNIDEKPFGGINYYKLKIVSTTGEIKYSNVLKINVDEVQTMEVLVLKNPVTEAISLQVNLPEKGSVVVELFTMNGKVVLQKKYNLYKGSNRIFIEGKIIISGTYQIAVTNTKGEKLTHTIIKL